MLTTSSGYAPVVAPLIPGCAAQLRPYSNRTARANGILGIHTGGRASFARIRKEKAAGRPQATSGRPNVPSGPGGGGGRKLRPTGESSEGSGDNNSLPLAIVTAVFAALILAGGIFGYIKKGSTTSVAVSTLFALVYFGAALLIRKPTTAVPGIRVSLGASVALGGYMANGYLKTRKLFPQGVFAGLSLTLALAYISQGLA